MTDVSFRDAALDQLVQYTSVVGTVLTFRRLIRDALAAVTQESVPFLFKCVK